jgi:hypothetical protein
MSDTTQFKVPTASVAAVHRREFLCLAPSAALASSIPLGVTLPRSGDQISIGGALTVTAERLDNGNLKGFLRQYGAVHDQRLVLYKPYDERSAYLLGTQNVVVPRRKQTVCVGEFRVTRLPDYFGLIREQGRQIDVESMRFPIRKTFFSRSGGEY